VVMQDQQQPHDDDDDDEDYQIDDWLLFVAD
jgi:hypothetical protein